MGMALTMKHVVGYSQRRLSISRSYNNKWEFSSCTMLSASALIVGTVQVAKHLKDDCQLLLTV